MFDSNGDGDRDRIYVGDTGGQVWRVDLEPNITTTAGLIPKVRLFAQVSDDANVAQRRKFFYRPDIVQVTDNIYSNTARYDLITLASGNRADPLNTDVDDIVVALRDRFVNSLPDSDGDGVADADIDGDGTDDPPLSLSDLFDATDFFNAPTGDDLTGSNGLKQADGWYINLEANGEKGLAPPVVLAGRMFFTSYLPEGVVDTSTCTISEGTGRLYGVNLLTGAAFPWDMVNNDTVTNKESRYMSLGSGIPSEAVPIFMPKGVTLLIGSGGGAKTVDPGINLAREQTYWYR
jgi:type IV pilus assembly protein PilY1